MSILMSIIGILVTLGVAYLFSNNRKNVKWKPIAIMFGMQILSVLFIFKTTIGGKIVEGVAGYVAKIMAFANTGISFVTGGWVPEGTVSVFFLNVMLITVFTSALISLLNYIRVLPYTIKFIGSILSKITGLPMIESFAGVGAVVLGQSEVLLSIKNNVQNLTTNRLLIVSGSAMGSISASLVGVYMTMLEPKYVLVAMILNMFSMLMIGSILSPVDNVNKDEKIDIKAMIKEKSVFEAIGNGAIDGGKVALIVSGMLIAYLGLIEMFNAISSGLVGMDLTTILGYVFAPIMFVAGVPVDEVVKAGSVMATKLIANEFVSISMLSPMVESLSAKTTAILSVAQISFASVGSIGMIAGSVQAFNGKKASEISKYGLRLLAIAFIGSLFSGIIVGLFV
ncbi:NupC/NupG family nucleoside CNT transporter [Bacillus cereus group sp. Bc015]|uniref:NupC/NupG family nucleoside CNT transporter n=1 Tax=Bacillus cereus group sp. Bc015 TaxID=3018123 RepID=UPI0022DF6A1E|nr:nucleoside transporter C-terminal domain-containing protein [Bacillus cereus group sp. Bc015]MDA2738428.1 NupC/NupG family nucleoside CNT transporter [Bacillus cereus group sp. Bc015]